jgi:hypothetical protein
MEKVRDEYEEMRSIDTSLIESLKNYTEVEDTGLGDDIKTYLKSAKKASDMVRDDPSILDKFAIDINTGKDQWKNQRLSQIEKILYFRSNPWKIVDNIIGKDIMNMTVSEGNEFKELTPLQKKYLRDFLDPRKMRMLRNACRGGSKTMDAALGSFCFQYVNPYIRILVTSGSLTQSEALFRYYSIFAINTQFTRLLLKERLLKNKGITVCGGWMLAFPASMKQTKGQRPDMVIIDEACEADSELILASQSGAITSHNIKFLTQGTPDKLEHIMHDWFMDYVRQKNLEPEQYALIPNYLRWHYYEQTAFDCPWIDKRQIEILTELYGGTHTHLYKIFILGQFAPASGLVFDAELVNEAMVEEVPKDVTLSYHTLGLDVGHVHPTSIVMAARGSDEKVYVFYNWEKIRAPEEVILNKCSDLSGKYQGLRVVADAAPIQLFMNLKLKYGASEQGISVKKVPFSKNKGPMISVVRAFLETRTVKIVRRPCEKVLNQLFTYSYEKNTGKPQKVNDDHVDALMLALWEHRSVYVSKRFHGGPYKQADFGKLLEMMDDEVGVYEKDKVNKSDRAFSSN